MKTILYERHRALGAKIVSFAEWEMPIQYQSILAEHQAVRERVGLFDVSHMGRISVQGPEAEKLLDDLSTNRLSNKEEGSATYTVWCQKDGGSVDDLLVYKVHPTSFFIIANAGNRQKDLDHLKHYAKSYQVEIKDHYQDGGILALQGPQALPLLTQLYPAVSTLKPMHFIQQDDVFISRTGYTGAGGFEIYSNLERIALLWDQLLKEGKVYGIEPVGLGARDTLRLEMGFALYGHELSEKIAPSESVSAWTIKEDKSHFIGKEALATLEASGKKRHSYGIRLLDKGIAREGFPVYKDGHQIGSVTSGSFSPTLNQAIALILVERPLEITDSVEIEIRGTRCRAEVVPLPFVRKNQ